MGNDTMRGMHRSLVLGLACLSLGACIGVSASPPEAETSLALVSGDGVDGGSPEADGEALCAPDPDSTYKETVCRFKGKLRYSSFPFFVPVSPPSPNVVASGPTPKGCFTIMVDCGQDYVNGTFIGASINNQETSCDPNPATLTGSQTLATTCCPDPTEGTPSPPYNISVSFTCLYSWFGQFNFTSQSGPFTP
jgi:hypothetical protein